MVDIILGIERENLAHSVVDLAPKDFGWELSMFIERAIIRDMLRSSNG